MGVRGGVGGGVGTGDEGDAGGRVSFFSSMSAAPVSATDANTASVVIRVVFIRFGDARKVPSLAGVRFGGLRPRKVRLPLLLSQQTLKPFLQFLFLLLCEFTRGSGGLGI